MAAGSPTEVWPNARTPGRQKSFSRPRSLALHATGRQEPLESGSPAFLLFSNTIANSPSGNQGPHQRDRLKTKTLPSLKGQANYPFLGKDRLPDLVVGGQRGVARGPSPGRMGQIGGDRLVGYDVITGGKKRAGSVSRRASYTLRVKPNAVAGGSCLVVPDTRFGVLRWLIRHGVRKFTHRSARAVYGVFLPTGRRGQVGGVTDSSIALLRAGDERDLPTYARPSQENPNARKPGTISPPGPAATRRP
jgi:hypothetical protein